MPIILCIETATPICSVAITNNNQILFSKESEDDQSHSSSLAVFIDEGMKKCKLNYNNLDAIAVSKGPGSYTGLRIGVSTAKGICYGANKSLISVSTLESLAKGAINKFNSENNDAWYCPMIDARRMEVYNALFDINGNQISDIKAEVINDDSFKEVLEDRIVYFFGDGALKCKQLLIHKNARFIDIKYPSAVNMVSTAINKYKNQEFENTAYFEPFYLKDFIATIPKKHIYK